MGERPCHMRAIIAVSPYKKISCCQPVQDRQCRLLGPPCQVARRAHARWATLLAGAGGNELACFLDKQSVRSKEGFGKADAAGIRVEEIKIRFEEFFCVGGNGVFEARWREIAS